MAKEEKFGIKPITDLYEPTPNSHFEIFKMDNRRRRYSPSDFKKQTFIPDLD